MEGTITRTAAKSRTEGECGLPKPAMPLIEATVDGIVGDYNHYRTVRKGATRDRAVLIFTADKLEELVREGWPVAPGDLGENLTVDGLAYALITPGQRYLVGDVLLEITEACQPCKNLATLPYVGDGKAKEFIATLVGRRGWYAKVLEEGTIRPGDKMALNEPISDRS